MAYWSGNKLKTDPGNPPRVTHSYELWAVVVFIVLAIIVKLF